MNCYDYVVSAVRHDRMRGGRNKFGPMYKRDRARKLQVMRNRTSVVPVGIGGVNLYPGSSNSSNSSHPAAVSSNSLSGSNQNTMYTTPLHTIKQEIQIPQVTSMTSSPDSSPSPVQLPHGLTMSASTNNSSGLSTQGQVIAQQTDPSTGGIQWQISTSPNSGNRVRKHILRSLPPIFREKIILNNSFFAGIFFWYGCGLLLLLWLDIERDKQR